MKLEILVAELYEAFNGRDVEAALSFMSEDVSWPKASEGGRVIGKDEVRAYWGRQWKEFDPQVVPIAVFDLGEGKARVKVHQLVKSTSGDVLSDGVVWHHYAISDGRIKRMDLGPGDGGAGQAASSAFARH